MIGKDSIECKYHSRTIKGRSNYSNEKYSRIVWDYCSRKFWEGKWNQKTLLKNWKVKLDVRYMFLFLQFGLKMLNLGNAWSAYVNEIWKKSFRFLTFSGHKSKEHIIKKNPIFSQKWNRSGCCSRLTFNGVATVVKHFP